MKIVIEGEFPTLNQVVAASKTHYGAYAKMKKTHTQKVMASVKGLPYIQEKADIECTWYRKNRRSDPDNVASGIKFILDGFVESGLLDNDGWKQIGTLVHKFEIDKDNPRVEVRIAQQKTLFN